MTPEPIHDVAHLGHVEIYTDKFDESLDFFTRVFGLTESGRDADSAYLRAFDDYEFHSMKLTRHHTTGIGHIGYRVASPQALERRVAAIAAAGYGIGWVDGDQGHGRAYRFADPFGHVFEVYWDTVKYQAPAGERAGAQEHRSTLSRPWLLSAPDRPSQPPGEGRVGLSRLHGDVPRHRASPR